MKLDTATCAPPTAAAKLEFLVARRPSSCRRDDSGSHSCGCVERNEQVVRNGAIDAYKASAVDLSAGHPLCKQTPVKSVSEDLFAPETLACKKFALSQ